MKISVLFHIASHYKFHVQNVSVTPRPHQSDSPLSEGKSLIRLMLIHFTPQTYFKFPEAWFLQGGISRPL